MRLGGSAGGGWVVFAAPDAGAEHVARRCCRRRAMRLTGWIWKSIISDADHAAILAAKKLTST